MSGLEGNISGNIFGVAKKVLKQPKELTPKPNLIENPENQAPKNIQGNQTSLNQSLVNTNSNIPVNQRVQVSPSLNQSALNASNLNQSNLNQQTDIKSNINSQIQSTPTQVEFKGPSDLPAYAGISNMSLKSWIAGQEGSRSSNLEALEQQLTATLDAIKGFQKKNYEGFDEGTSKQNQSKFEILQKIRERNLLLLSHIFASQEQVSPQKTEILINFSNFRKLGTNLSQEGFDTSEYLNESKLSPPLPSETHTLTNFDSSKIKCLRELLALPHEFPECLRLFAKDKLEMNGKELTTFLKQRVTLAQELIFGSDEVLTKAIASFIPLLNQRDYPVLLPLLLLYYPLPLPKVEEDFNFLATWKKKKTQKDKQGKIIASCEIYYRSKKRGTFLLKFELNENNEFAFDVQTQEYNNGVVRDIEEAISESMVLLEHPPILSELNVMLTKEVYKATDIDEELSIVSSGPLRLEIVLAVYGALVVLNKINEEPEPSGVIDIIE